MQLQHMSSADIRGISPAKSLLVPGSLEMQHANIVCEMQVMAIQPSKANTRGYPAISEDTPLQTPIYFQSAAAAQ